MKNILPMEVVEKILSYGDPNITERKSTVISQLKYYTNEYNFLRKQPYNFYYKWNKNEIIYFILNRCHYKKEVNCLVTHNILNSCHYKRSKLSSS